MPAYGKLTLAEAARLYDKFAEPTPEEVRAERLYYVAYLIWCLTLGSLVAYAF